MWWNTYLDCKVRMMLVIRSISISFINFLRKCTCNWIFSLFSLRDEKVHFIQPNNRIGIKIFLFKDLIFCWKANIDQLIKFGNVKIPQNFINYVLAIRILCTESFPLSLSQIESDIQIYWQDKWTMKAHTFNPVNWDND